MSHQTVPEIDACMLELLQAELDMHSRALEEGLIACEKNTSAQAIEPLMRAAHSIKGAARIVGIQAVADLAHAMEDRLIAVQENKQPLTAELVDALLAANELMLELARAPLGELTATIAQSRPPLEQMTERLQQGPFNSPAEPPATGTTDEAPTAPPPPPAPPPAPPSATQTAGEQETGTRVIRVQADSLSRLMGLSGEFLVETRTMNRFAHELQRIKDLQRSLGTRLEQEAEQSRLREQAPRNPQALEEMRRHLELAQDAMLEHIDDFSLFTRRLEQLSDRLYNEVMVSRMRPISSGLHGMARMVRDLARQLEKHIDLVVIGGNTPVDRDILDKLEAPLTHLLRNAADHGIESPAERTRAGKNPGGTIRLEAEHRAGMLHIVVRDDGRGIHKERIREKALARHLIAADMAHDLTEDEWAQFLFLPGFSTTEHTSDISGRGVGLDVVHNMVREVGGDVRIETGPDGGTAFHLVLPLTLSVLRTLVVRVSTQQFAVALSKIDHLLEIPDDEIRAIEDRRFFTFEGEHIGLVSAGQVLGMNTPPLEGSHHRALLVSDSLNRYALEVDAFIGQRDLVVLPLDERLGRIPNISAGAVREDGSPLLILDVDDLVRSIDHLLTRGKPLSMAPSKSPQTPATKRILVVDDSITVREVERKLLAVAGYDVSVAVDGVDGWNKLQHETFDLLVSDVDMPRMNGIELVERIRSTPGPLMDIPIIIVSYKDREEDRLRGLRAGADHYLTKSSFQDETLVQAVRDLVGGDRVTH